ncbi:hypothetical protein FPV67DRAFT_1019092 [Lyophyllum atratum]|nr:hypothetical protein FPV67DRAFT_1019092 [Lyophyllum atratum]
MRRRALASLAIAAVGLYLVLSAYRAARLPRSIALRTSLDLFLDEAIPDHQISRDFNLLQHSLSCFTQDTWTADQKNYRFAKQEEQFKAPSYSFRSSCPARTMAPITDLCSSLVAKQVLFVGPETTYYLHSLWLNALEAFENRSMSCHGPEFCTFHHICRSPSVSTSSPNNHDRFKKFPRPEELLATNSSILRYVLSTTLHTAPNPKDDAYTVPIVDPETGVRVKNAYWLAHAKRAHVVVMNRGPIPAPAWTYENSGLGGNWSFADRLYLNRSTAYVDDAAHSLGVRVVNAALHTTLTAFLPTTLPSLRAIESHPVIREKLLVWHGSWYMQPRCSVRNRPRGAFVIKDPLNPMFSVDPWTLYYNAQVYMQNRLMEKLLPQYGIVFYAQGIPEAPEGDEYRVVPGKRRFAGDCLLHAPTTSDGKAMQNTFLSGLAKLVEEIVDDVDVAS